MDYLLTNYDHDSINKETSSAVSISKLAVDIYRLSLALNHLIYIVYILDSLKVRVEILGAEIPQILGTLREVVLTEPLAVDVLGIDKSEEGWERLVALIVRSLGC